MEIRRWLIAVAATATIGGGALMGAGATLAQQSTPDTPAPSAPAPASPQPKTGDATGQGCNHDKGATGSTSSSTGTGA
ncbi:MAG TPA: hypothetical protein VFB90_00545 [Dehalococcoidia bacterium]|nr:hypothetical protein [Dehalococcoidia bacterium]